MSTPREVDTTSPADLKALLIVFSFDTGMREGHGRLSAEIQAAVEKGVDPIKSWVLKRKKENEEKRDKPEPDKRFKFFNPVTGQEHEGTAESARLCATRYLACLRDDADDVVAARFGTAPCHIAMLAASNVIFEIGIGEKTVECYLKPLCPWLATRQFEVFSCHVL